MPALKIGVVMDPIEKINIDKDTTFVLLLEAQQRNHEVYYMELDDLFIRGGTPYGRFASSSCRAPDTPLSTGRIRNRMLSRTLTSFSCARIRRST